MKIILNAVLLVIIIFLGWMLISSIQEPIKFQNEKSKRLDAVKTKLRKVRVLQEAYRDVTGQYAGSFDELFDVVRNGEIMQVAVYGNEDDPTVAADEIRKDTTYISVAEYLNSTGAGINVDSLDYLSRIPYNDKNEQFTIEADTIMYQSTPRVPVVKVGASSKKFMGKYADKKYQQYDNTYDPNKIYGFGDLNSPTLSGNWE